MSLRPRSNRLRLAPRRTLLGVLALVTGLAGAVAAVPASAATGPAPTSAVPTVAHPVGDMPDEPTTLRISTFNLLGADHTAPGGNKRGWASGTQRMQWAVQLLRQNRIDVVGMQEMRVSQYDDFTRFAGSQYQIYPGPAAGQALKSNAIAWRSADWELVEGHSMKIQYFCDWVPMPYVLLRNRTTGRLAWFYNSHNPASVKKVCGSAQKRRDRDVQLEIGLVKQLRSAYPDVPVFITGDKNDRDRYLCPMVRGSEMQSANGGHLSGSSCVMPEGVPPVDWIMGSSDVWFSGYRALNSKLVRKTTDHRLVFSDAFIPSLESAQSGIRNVVMISVDGLRPSAIQSADTRWIHRMMADGASTLNARTQYQSVDRLPNAISILTGLRANPARGGHGVGWKGRKPPSTIPGSAGRYVSSVLGVTHDFGRRTAVVTSDKQMQVVRRSWNSRHGAADPYVPDNGADKINFFKTVRNDAQVFRASRDLIAQRHPSFMFVELLQPGNQGSRFGWHSNKYEHAIGVADRRIGRILRAINSSPRMAGHTAVIVTAEHGGTNRKGHPVSRRTNYQVPVIVTGPGVPAGVDLYALNPQLTDPGHARPSYGGRQPVRTAYLANLVTRLLGEPPIPGADMDPGQELNVFPLPAPTS